MSKDLRQTAADRLAGEIPRGKIGLRDLIKSSHGCLVLSGKTPLQNLPAREFFLDRKIGGPPAGALPKLFERCSPCESCCSKLISSMKS